MRKTPILGSVLAAAMALLAACQNSTTNNTTANANANMAGHDVSGNHDMANMNMDHDMSEMPGHDLMKSDPGAADAPYELQFLDSMIRHHEGAIAMAKMVLGKTQRSELKKFAQKIMDDQSKEIDYMKELREKLYAGHLSAVNMEMPGMVGGMKIMTSEHMKEMSEMEANHFDDHFLNMMTAHHQGAVTMSEEALKRSGHAEIKQLAGKILKAQQPEIDQMKKWKETWGNH